MNNNKKKNYVHTKRLSPIIRKKSRTEKDEKIIYVYDACTFNYYRFLCGLCTFALENGDGAHNMNHNSAMKQNEAVIKWMEKKKHTENLQIFRQHTKDDEIKLL